MTAHACKPDAKGTRRVPLEFDEKGVPTYASAASPESFSQHALCLHVPIHVIPVIFVPGIMGTNIRATKEANAQQDSAWSPPNGMLAGLGEVYQRVKQSPTDREKQLNPATTEVDPTGKISIPKNFFMLTEKEAKRRGWGALHAQSYGEILCKLEVVLNEQHKNVCTTAATPMDEWGMMRYLGGASDSQSGGDPEQSKWKQLGAKSSKAWNAEGSVPPLPDDEFKRLGGYYFPVWAHGYNWLKSNEDSGKALVDKIQEVLDFYDKSEYFKPEGRVILVSHSMGGYVTRYAAKQVPDKVLGVVHGVQPVAGAPVVYRRFRAGTETGGLFDIEGMAVASIIGWDAADITAIMANAPGPLELLPNQNYPAGWLKIEAEGSDGPRTLASLPQGDPYEEIYSRSTSEAWWGMVDENLIDPAKLITKKAPIDAYKITLSNVRAFHQALDRYAHPNTYAYYGIDPKQESFGTVRWQTRSSTVSKLSADALLALPSNAHSNLGKTTLDVGGESVSFKLSNHRDTGGDGTVPTASGAGLAQLQPAPQAVFRMTGFDHQFSYNDPHTVTATLYSIAKLVQHAKTPTAIGPK